MLRFLATPTSPLRRRFAQIAAWLVLSDLSVETVKAAALDHGLAPDQVADLFAPGLVPPLVPADLSSAEAEISGALLVDENLREVPYLLADQACSVVTERALTVAMDLLIIATEKREAAALAALEETSVRQAPYKLANRIPTKAFAAGLAVAALVELAVIFWLGRAAILPLMLIWLAAFAFFWLSRLADINHTIKLLKGKIALIDNHTKSLRCLVIASLLFKRNAAPALARAQEPELRGALLTILGDCAHNGEILDLHHFVYNLGAVLDTYPDAVSSDDRSLSLPAKEIHRLLADDCPEVHQAFSSRTREQVKSELHQGDSLGRLFGLDILAGPDGLIELACRLADEVDLTVIRAPIG